MTLEDVLRREFRGHGAMEDCACPGCTAHRRHFPRFYWGYNPRPLKAARDPDLSPPPPPVLDPLDDEPDPERPREPSWLARVAKIVAGFVPWGVGATNRKGALREAFKSEGDSEIQIPKVDDP